MKLFKLFLFVLLAGCMSEGNTICLDGKTYLKRAGVWYLHDSVTECLSDKEIKAIDE